MHFLNKAIFLSCFILTAPVMGINQPESLLTSFKKNIGDFLCYWITSSDVSDETIAYAQDLMQKIDPHQKITRIQKFNTFGEYLFGKNNAFAIPFINYVILNTKSLKKLPEETQRFVIGRTLYSMAHPKDYLTYKVLLPLMYSIFFQIHDSPLVKESISRLTPVNILHSALFTPFTQDSIRNNQTIQDFRTGGRNIIYHLFAALHIAYASRHLEWETDMETAKLLNCAKGGIEFFKNYREFKGGGTFLAEVSAQIPLFEWLNYGAFALLEKFAPRLTAIDPKISLYGITLAHPRGGSFISQIKGVTPNQLVPYSNALSHGLSRIPILNYFCHSASAKDRIAALEKLIQPAAQPSSS